MIPGQLALAIPAARTRAPDPVPPEYWACTGPRRWVPVQVTTRYGPSVGMPEQPFPLAVTKPLAPRNVEIRRPDGSRAVVPVRSLRRRNPCPAPRRTL